MELETGLKQKSHRLKAADQPAISMHFYMDFESCRQLATEWDAFVERVSGDIFLTWDWCRIWWKYYGEGRSLRLYIFRAEERIVGLMPMFLETVRLWPLSVRQAKLVGSDFTAAQYRPAIEDQYLHPVLRSLIGEVGELGLDQILLGPLAGRYTRCVELFENLQCHCQSRYNLKVKEKKIQTYYRVAETYAQWLASLKSSQRKPILRDFRKLEQQSLSYVLEIGSANNWETMFEDFVKLHQEYWNARGKPGHFPEGACALDFHRELARAQLARGRLRLFCLRCTDGSRTYNYCFRCGDTYFEYISSRTLSSPPGVSVSRMLHSEMVKQAHKESVTWFDSMQGIYEYKKSLGGEIFPIRTICLSRKDLLGRIRIKLFNGAAQLLHLFYYRIYYYRLAAKLHGHPRKGPSRHWIRTVSSI